MYTVGRLSDTNIVNDFMIRSLMLDNTEETFGKTMFDFIKDNALAIGEVKVISEWNGLILSILSGDTVILVNGSVEAVSGSTRGGEVRQVTEPSSQVVIRGPKDGFTESIAVNVSLVRRRIKNPNLWLETMTIGNNWYCLPDS
ncbi:hypothetical protein PAECIP111802_05276 [Paenibacillus allorhizosphaerae]|uniref:Uncharacterized protein n=1 Tax=Paenibacillus allorhizosphaerae TaxID=2849866 RepID=A0ABM8VP95_9BACL|nr:hypothetical protein PAECIP111802_05276 [Paenibacillus allorhizosphaerae]